MSALVAPDILKPIPLPWRCFFLKAIRSASIFLLIAFILSLFVSFLASISSLLSLTASFFTFLTSSLNFLALGTRDLVTVVLDTDAIGLIIKP